MNKLPRKEPSPGYTPVSVRMPDSTVEKIEHLRDMRIDVAMILKEAVRKAIDAAYTRAVKECNIN